MNVCLVYLVINWCQEHVLRIIKVTLLMLELLLVLLLVQLCLPVLSSLSLSILFSSLKRTNKHVELGNVGKDDEAVGHDERDEKQDKDDSERDDEDEEEDEEDNDDEE